MRLEAHLPHATLARLIRELAPVRIHMVPPEEGNRWLELDEPSLIQPVPGRGLRIQSTGRLRFDIGGVPLAVRIKALSLVLEPAVVGRRQKTPRLAFAIHLEEGDLAGVPAFLERPMIRRINAALNPESTKMVWAFVDTLTRRFELPDRLEPLDALALTATDGEIHVDEEGTHFAMELQPHFERSGELSEPDDDAFAPSEREPASGPALRRLLGVSAET